MKRGSEEGREGGRGKEERINDKGRYSINLGSMWHWSIKSNKRPLRLMK